MYDEKKRNKYLENNIWTVGICDKNSDEIIICKSNNFAIDQFSYLGKYFK